MSISVIQCGASSILLTTCNLSKDNSVVSIEDAVEKNLSLSNINDAPDSLNWIQEASLIIKELIQMNSLNHPVIILLPEFCFLTKVVTVPRVDKSKQMDIVQTHIRLQGIDTHNYFIKFDIIQSSKLELEIICYLVQQKWIDLFCKSLDSIGEKIIAIKSPYNSNNPHFSFFEKIKHSVNLIPSRIKVSWIFRRYQKIILIGMGCFVIALAILSYKLHDQKNYYTNALQSFKHKMEPLQEIALILKQNENIITLYNEGLKALEVYKTSSNSWAHFLNSLQNALITVPNANLHSLKIVKQEFEGKAKKTHKKIEPKSFMNITGSLKIDSLSKDNAIDVIKNLILEITKIPEIEEAKNLYFDIEKVPEIPFAVSLVLKSECF